MTFFIAIAFFCVGNDCYFWKSKDNYYTEETCITALAEYIKSKQGKLEVAGSCLKVDLRNNI
jgi:hypothetical protein